MLKFELSLEEANIILASLGKMPYESVAGLIAKLQKQAAPQLAEQNESPDAPAAE